MKEGADRLRLVYDTHVLLSMLGFPGGRMDALWELLQQGRIELFVSEFILEELSKNLRLKVRLESAEAEEVVRLLRNRARIVSSTEKISVIREKDADNRILECAAACEAQVLVTGNFKHIRPLGSFRGIEILSPREFLNKHFPGF